LIRRKQRTLQQTSAPSPKSLLVSPPASWLFFKARANYLNGYGSSPAAAGRKNS
jgi:hypothetical protein